MAQSFSQCNLGVDKLQVKAFGHCLAGHFAFVDIEAGEKPASYLAMRVQSLKTLVRQSKAIGQGSVIQRSSAGLRHGARHVRDTIVDDAIDDISRLGVCGRL